MSNLLIYLNADLLFPSAHRTICSRLLWFRNHDFRSHPVKFISGSIDLAHQHELQLVRNCKRPDAIIRHAYLAVGVDVLDGFGRAGVRLPPNNCCEEEQTTGRSSLEYSLVSAFSPHRQQFNCFQFFVRLPKELQARLAFPFFQVRHESKDIGVAKFQAGLQVGRAAEHRRHFFLKTAVSMFASHVRHLLRAHARNVLSPPACNSVAKGISAFSTDCFRWVLTV